MSAQYLKFVFTTQAAVAHSFDFEGGFTIGLQPVYRAEDSDAGEKIVEEVRNRWEIEGFVVSPDGTADKAWDDFHTIRDALSGAGGDPVVKVELIRDPDGANVTELTIDDANDYYDLRVDEVNVTRPDVIPAAALYKTVFGLSVVITARKIGGQIGANEAVTWEQTLRRTYRNGLLRLESEVTLSTREGVDAVALAATLCSLPIPSTSYSFKTGNTVAANGVDVVELDPDTSQDPDRTVTRVLATCVLEQNGISVSNTGAGTAPDEVFWRETITTSSAERRTLKTREVSAAGPSAKAWCLTQKPSWAVDESRQELARDSAWAYTWTAEVRQTGAQASATTLVGEITGGFQAFDLEPVTGGYHPVRFDGPFMPWQLSLTITVTRHGGGGDRADLPFPPELPAPWILDRNASSEQEPVKEEPGKRDSESRWSRTASLVYRSATAPQTPPVRWLRDQTGTVETYWVRRA